MEKRKGNGKGSIYRTNDGSWRAQITIKGNRLSFNAQTEYHDERLRPLDSE